VLPGPLGAGKTALVRGLARGLGVAGPVTSPTFVIARIHPSLTGGPALVHADAYRLGSPAEVDDLDLDADTATSVTVVEWGGGLVEDLASGWLDVTLTPLPGGGAEDEPRSVRLTGRGGRWPAAAGALRQTLTTVPTRH
jgi:tRNA threonylcarbamoyladenosine biosynthesis protein TsaE